MDATSTAREYRARAIRIAGPIGSNDYSTVADHGHRECGRWVAILATYVPIHSTARQYRAAAMERPYVRPMRPSERGRDYAAARARFLLRCGVPHRAMVATRCLLVLAAS